MKQINKTLGNKLAEALSMPPGVAEAVAGAIEQKGLLKGSARYADLIEQTTEEGEGNEDGN